MSRTSCRLNITFKLEYHRIVGRLISNVTFFKPTFFVSSYGTVLMFYHPLSRYSD